MSQDLGYQITGYLVVLGLFLSTASFIAVSSDAHTRGLPLTCALSAILAVFSAGITGIATLLVFG